MELNGAVPEHIVWPQPGDLARGIDAQLDKAVAVLMDDVQGGEKTNLSPGCARRVSDEVADRIRAVGPRIYPGQAMAKSPTPGTIMAP